MNILKPFIVIALALTLSFCGLDLQRFSVDVDAIASPLASGKRSYILIPGDPNVQLLDLQFQEFAGYLVNALRAQGYYLADTVDEAELVIMLAYGIGDPQTVSYTTSIPVFGQTGVASSTTTGTARTVGNTTRINATTVNNPTFGITGYTTGTRTETNYSRYALITAFDHQLFRENQQELELWRTTLTSTGSSGDLRQVFPIMIGAGTSFLGQNSGQRQNVILTETDNSVILVKGASTVD